MNNTPAPYRKPADPWQFELRESFKEINSLLDYLQIDATQLTPPYTPAFPLRVTRHFASLMTKGDPQDPLLLQVLPRAQEQASTLMQTDIVGDLAASPVPGLIHKYQHRALLILTGACAIHCRYCFRQHYDYSEGQITSDRLAQCINYLNTNQEINELILSGGDPLSLSDSKLSSLLRQILKAAPQIKTIRFHSRQPVVLPSRLGDGFKALLAELDSKIVMVLHINHANEISTALINAIQSMPKSVIWLNQSVLLNGINDSISILAALSRKLFEAGVLPYYLNQLDLIRGVEHFAVEDDHALALIQSLREILPGYLVPKLVSEIAGATSKQPLETMLRH